MVKNYEIVYDLYKVNKILGHVPSKREYRLYGTYCPETVARRFDSWNNAMKIVFKTTKPEPKKHILCMNCKKETKNPKFCSRSCSTSFHNNNNNGRLCGRVTKKEKQMCKYCQACFLPSQSQVFCSSCKNLKIIKTNKNEYVLASNATKKRFINF